MESYFIKEETHGFIVKRYLNWDDYNWIAITPKGSISVFKDRSDSTLYAVYNPHKGHYHVHMPFEDGIWPIDKEAEEVLKEVLECLHYAECYIDKTEETREIYGHDMIYNMNPILLRRFTPKRFAFFGLGPHITKLRG